MCKYENIADSKEMSATAMWRFQGVSSCDEGDLHFEKEKVY
jgi:hypothetical protein